MYRILHRNLKKQTLRKANRFLFAFVCRSITKHPMYNVLVVVGLRVENLGLQNSWPNLMPFAPEIAASASVDTGGVERVHAGTSKVFKLWIP